MRPATFLCLAVLLSVAVFAHSFFPATQATQPWGAPLPQSRPDLRGSDREPMVTRAYIEVVPLDLIAERNRDLESLRNRVTRVEMDDLRMASAKPELREQLARQVEIMNALLQFIQREQSDEGKSPAALEVKRHLNEIEGKMNCQACHTSVVADHMGWPARAVHDK